MALLTSEQILKVIDDTESFLDSNNFKKFYHYLYGTFRKPLQICEFTEFLLNAGLSPLDYMDKVPTSFLFFSENIDILFIPNNIEVIDRISFYGSKVNQVTFEEGSKLKTIAFGAFGYCEKLESVVLPDGIETIEDNAFSFSGLKELVIPASVSKVGEGTIIGTDCKPVFLGTQEQWDQIEKPDDQHDRLIRRIEIKG